MISTKGHDKELWTQMPNWMVSPTECVVDSTVFTMVEFNNISTKTKFQENHNEKMNHESKILFLPQFIGDSRSISNMLDDIISPFTEACPSRLVLLIFHCRSIWDAMWSLHILYISKVSLFSWFSCRSCDEKN